MYRPMLASANPRGHTIPRSFLLTALLSIPLLGSVPAGTRPKVQREIILAGDSAHDRYWFTPSRITVKQGDVMVFRVQSGGPHALVLEGAGVSKLDRDAWNRAMPRRVGDLRGPLLVSGQSYSVTVPLSASPGRITLYCLPHRAYDMRVEITVE
jgi:plastocyanin